MKTNQEKNLVTLKRDHPWQYAKWRVLMEKEGFLTLSAPAPDDEKGRRKLEIIVHESEVNR